MKKSELKELIMECMLETAEDDEIYDESFKQTLKDFLKDWNKSTGKFRNTLNTDLNADVKDFWKNIKSDYNRNKLDKNFKNSNRIKFDNKDYVENGLKKAVELFITKRMEKDHCTLTTAKKDLRKIIDRICDSFE